MRHHHLGDLLLELGDLAVLDLARAGQVALGEPLRGVGHARIVRAVDGNAAAGDQFFYAADVIGVMMGDQDGGQLELFRGEIAKHRLGVAWIHHDGVRGVADGPDIVVVERPQRDYFISIHGAAFG